MSRCRQIFKKAIRKNLLHSANTAGFVKNYLSFSRAWWEMKSKIFFLASSFETVCFTFSIFHFKIIIKFHRAPLVAVAET